MTAREPLTCKLGARLVGDEEERLLGSALSTPPDNLPPAVDADGLLELPSPKPPYDNRIEVDESAELGIKERAAGGGPNGLVAVVDVVGVTARREKNHLATFLFHKGDGGILGLPYDRPSVVEVVAAAACHDLAAVLLLEEEGREARRGVCGRLDVPRDVSRAVDSEGCARDCAFGHGDELASLEIITETLVGSVVIPSSDGDGGIVDPGQLGGCRKSWYFRDPGCPDRRSVFRFPDDNVCVIDPRREGAGKCAAIWAEVADVGPRAADVGTVGQGADDPPFDEFSVSDEGSSLVDGLHAKVRPGRRKVDEAETESAASLN